MHSEHLTNVHPGWAAVGWVVAVAVTAVFHLAFIGTGLVPPGIPEHIAVVLAVLVGFFAGGFFVGMRWSDAPILNGAAIALISLILWFVSALVAPPDLGTRLGLDDTVLLLGSVLAQLAAAIAGALAGRSVVLRGQVPDPAAMPPEA